MNELTLATKPPIKWDDVYIQGIPFPYLIELERSKILEFVKNAMLSKIVEEDFIFSLNLSLQEFKFKPRVNLKTWFTKDISDVMRIDEPQEILLNNDFKKSFIEILMEGGFTHKFIHVDNFSFSSDSSKIATKDFRILIDDLKGTVPKDVKLNIASVAAMMLSGIIQYPIGYDYITDKMKKFGYTSFEYQGNGYLHITIAPKLRAIKPVNTEGVSGNPKV